MQEMWTDPRTPVLVSIKGLSLEPREIELLQKYRPVGVILFGENCDNESQVIELTNHLKRLGFFVAIDIEGKQVNRFRKFHPLIKNAVDFCDAPVKTIYDYYYDSALYAKKMGIDIMFGPVTDVCDIPESFIYQRCFSGEARRVSECAFAVIKAYQDAGVFPVIKHLPGHGKAVDSHRTLPIVSASAEELYTCDIAASKEVIRSVKAAERPLPGGMPSHVIYEKIDPNFPGTLSAIVIKKIIREYIGMGDGILFSDAMRMNALVDFLITRDRATKENYRPTALVGFLKAGGDVAIMDLITNLELTPDSFPEKDPNIMSRLLKFMGKL